MEKPEQPGGQEIRVSRAPAVNRAVAILRVLSEANAPINLNAICQELGLIPGTCYHLLRALELEGLVRVSEVDKRYSLGLGVVTLARQALEAAITTGPLKQELEAVTSEFGISCCVLEVLPGDRAIIIATSLGRSTFSILFEVGRWFPAFAGASGRCVAAHSGLDRAALQGKFTSVRWAQPPSFDEWLQQIECVRAHGVGADHGQYMRGFINIAAPIFRERRATRSILVTVSASQFDAAMIERMTARLALTARRLSG